MADAKQFLYVLTIQGSWNRTPTAQVTVTGVMENEERLTRSEILHNLQNLAQIEWYNRYRGVSSDNFSVIFFSLEEDAIL